MSIHPNARGFARAAAGHDRARPDYPAAAVDWILERLRPRRVADVAAGTGRLTRALVERGIDVVAVDPVAEMRAVLERTVPVSTRAPERRRISLSVTESSTRSLSHLLPDDERAALSTGSARSRRSESPTSRTSRASASP